jgi:sugar lactone lactonase YvrE
MGNSSYTSRDANFQGIIGFNDYIFLPLKKGKNELMIAVAEASGGWAFMFQDVDAIYEHPGIKKQWEIKNKFRYPESVVYDKKRDVLYVSNYTYERDGFISKVRMNGEIEKIDWIPGILQPSGICIYNDKLYVVGRYNLVEVDIETQTIINRYPFPEPVFANDVTCDESGNFFVTDGAKACIYKLENGKFTEWITGDWLVGVNGILVEKDKVYVGTSNDGSLKSIDVNTKEIKTFFTFGPSVVIDGLRTDGKGNFLVSDYDGRLVRISPDGKSELLLNTKSRQITLADFEYIPEKNLVVIPTFNDNRVMMYNVTR